MNNSKNQNQNRQTYGDFVSKIKTNIQTAQLRASVWVNKELLLLYWEIGNKLVENNNKKFGDKKTLEQISKDIKNTFKSAKGFSPGNLKRMCLFFQAYPNRSFVEEYASKIPWAHNILIIQKIKDHKIRKWYILKSIQNNWSRSILSYKIDCGFHKSLTKKIEQKS